MITFIHLSLIFTQMEVGNNFILFIFSLKAKRQKSKHNSFRQDDCSTKDSTILSTTFFNINRDGTTRYTQQGTSTVHIGYGLRGHMIIIRQSEARPNITFGTYHICISQHKSRSLIRPTRKLFFKLVTIVSSKEYAHSCRRLKNLMTGKYLQPTL